MGATVFAVFRGGVYRHECAGIFTTLELAKGAADRLALSEPDGHHDYEVVPFTLDVAGEPGNRHVVISVQQHPGIPPHIEGHTTVQFDDSVWSMEAVRMAMAFTGEVFIPR